MRAAQLDRAPSRWLAPVALDDPPAGAAFHDYPGAVDKLGVRCASLERAHGELVKNSRWGQQLVARLRCMRLLAILRSRHWSSSKPGWKAPRSFDLQCMETPGAFSTKAIGITCGR